MGEGGPLSPLLLVSSTFFFHRSTMVGRLELFQVSVHEDQFVAALRNLHSYGASANQMGDGVEVRRACYERTSFMFNSSCGLLRISSDLCVRGGKGEGERQQLKGSRGKSSSSSTRSLHFRRSRRNFSAKDRPGRTAECIRERIPQGWLCRRPHETGVWVFSVFSYFK